MSVFFQPGTETEPPFAECPPFVETRPRTGRRNGSYMVSLGPDVQFTRDGSLVIIKCGKRWPVVVALDDLAKVARLLTEDYASELQKTAPDAFTAADDRTFKSVPGGLDGRDPEAE
jgi:hypothetical protein